MQIDETRETFKTMPGDGTARRYADALITAWSRKEIGRDTLRDGLIEIGQTLTGGLCDLGTPVRVRIT